MITDELVSSSSLTISVIVAFRRMPISIFVTKEKSSCASIFSSMHRGNIQTLMDWALIESACFLLASVSPLLRPPKYHIHHQQHPPPIRRYPKKKEVSNFETSQIHTKQINARSLARSIGNQKRLRNRKSHKKRQMEDKKPSVWVREQHV